MSDPEPIDVAEEEAKLRATCSHCLARTYRQEECVCEGEQGDAEDFDVALADERRKAAARRAERLGELVERYPPQDPGAPSDGRFLLVETSDRDGGYYLTTHDSPADAADYHDGQEYPDDWSIRALIDLDTGEEYGSEPHTLFTRRA